MSLACKSCGSMLTEPRIIQAVPSDFLELKRFLGSFTGAGFEKHELAHMFLLRASHNGQKIVGAAELFPCSDGSFYLCRVKVARHLRRQGIGQYLFEYAIGHAQKLGARDVYVVTRFRETAPAVRIVRKLGAIEISQAILQKNVPRHMVDRYSSLQNRFWRFPL